MRRRLLGVIVGSVLALAIAGPALADTVPGPGNFRDSGDRTFLYAFGSCTTIEVSLSVSLAAVGSPNAYSYTQKNQYQNCTDTYRVRGEAADAEGTIVLNGSSIDAFGQLGSESFAFSTRCR